MILSSFPNNLVFKLLDCFEFDIIPLGQINSECPILRIRILCQCDRMGQIPFTKLRNTADQIDILALESVCIFGDKSHRYLAGNGLFLCHYAILDP